MVARTLLKWPVLATALFLVGCSGSPESPVAPGPVSQGEAGSHEDGSPLKVNAPAGLSPSGGVVVTETQVRLAFQAAAGRHVQPSGLQHRVELFNSSGTRIRQWTTGATSVTTEELEYSSSYSWRVQATLDGHDGPWSEVARFVTPDPPSPPECRWQPLEANRVACVLAVAAISEDWPRCASGSGSACHRFTREVARALSYGDPNWGMLGKPPGVWQCSLSACGSSVVGGLGEDVVVYCTGPGSCRNPSGPDGRLDWVAIDIVTGAGLPGAAAGWNPIPRAFNRGNNWWVPVP